MEKVFQTFKDLVNFDFNELEPSKSNYLKLIPADEKLPTVRKEFERRMRFSEKNDKTHPQITLEICPTWLIVIVYEHAYAKRKEFELPYKNGYYDSEYLRNLIQKIFEDQKPGWEFLTWSFLFNIFDYSKQILIRASY